MIEMGGNTREEEIKGPASPAEAERLGWRKLTDAEVRALLVQPPFGHRGGIDCGNRGNDGQSWLAKKGPPPVYCYCEGGSPVCYIGN